MLNLERSQWKNTLLDHAARYPKMEPADAVKLAYQSVFGGGHLVKDEASSLARLSEERASVLRSPEPFTTQEPFEPIGFGRARMMLSSGALAGLPDALLNRAFVLSSGEPSGNTALFQEALGVLQDAVFSGVFSFSPDAFSAYLSGYRASGCPMASHSEAYRLAYRPAYRVLNDRFVQALTALVKSGRSLVRSKAARALNALPPESAASLLELIPFSVREG